MVRRIVAVVALAVAGLLAVPALAMAATQPPYQAPSVTPVTEAWVAPVADTVSDPYTALASTGAGFSVETFVIIGALVLLVGVGLVILGNRLRRSSSQH